MYQNRAVGAAGEDGKEASGSSTPGNETLRVRRAAEVLSLTSYSLQAVLVNPRGASEITGRDHGEYQFRE